MGRHIGMQDPARRVFDSHKYVEKLEVAVTATQKSQATITLA